MENNGCIASPGISAVPSCDMDAVIAFINRVIREKDIDLHELSEVADVPYQTLYKILKSVTKDPRCETIFRISRALNISLDYLMVLSAGDQDTDPSLPLTVDDEPVTKSAIRHLVSAYQQTINVLKLQIASYERELKERKLSRLIRDILLAAAFAGLAFYVVWDLTHPTEGMIQYQVWRDYAAHAADKITDFFGL